jgi:hypothetical protein
MYALHMGYVFIVKLNQLGMVVHFYNPRTQEAAAGGSRAWIK